MRQVQPILGKAAGKVRAELKRREEAIKEREDRIRKLEEQDAVHLKTRRALIKERDAALAEGRRLGDLQEATLKDYQEARADAEALRERGLKLRRVLMGIAHDWSEHEAGKWAWKTCQEVWPEGEKELARLSSPAPAPVELPSAYQGRETTDDAKPAPAPTTIHDVLQARLERLRDKPAPAPAPCKHSWVEGENEADQLQTACELCGAIKPAPPAKDGGP